MYSSPPYWLVRSPAETRYLRNFEKPFTPKHKYPAAPEGTGSVGCSTTDTSALRAKSDTSELELRRELTPALIHAGQTCQRVVELAQ